jgi:alpha,alpha-trehalose phosphorylase
LHVLQAGARSEGRAIAAKGLTGPGYDGHTFWDTETFVLERARLLGFDGAVFPWRTITGAECSRYWPAGTAAFHIGADIADAVVRYVDATGDHEFEEGVGLELLAQTARLWRSLGHHDSEGRFRIDGVTGPDEYSAVADNNIYTNLTAQHNLRSAADAAERHPGSARRLGIDEEEMAAWRDAAAAMFVPYDQELEVHPQAGGFTDHDIWDFASTAADQCPLFSTSPTSTSPANRSSSRPTSCSPCTCEATPSPPSRRPGTSPTTKA